MKRILLKGISLILVCAFLMQPLAAMDTPSVPAQEQETALSPEEIQTIVDNALHEAENVNPDAILNEIDKQRLADRDTAFQQAKNTATWVNTLRWKIKTPIKRLSLGVYNRDLITAGNYAAKLLTLLYTVEAYRQAHIKHVLSLLTTKTDDFIAILKEGHTTEQQKTTAYAEKNFFTRLFSSQQTPLGALTKKFNKLFPRLALKAYATPLLVSYGANKARNTIVDSYLIPDVPAVVPLLNNTSLGAMAKTVQQHVENSFLRTTAQTCLYKTKDGLPSLLRLGHEPLSAAQALSTLSLMRSGIGLAWKHPLSTFLLFSTIALGPHMAGGYADHVFDTKTDAERALYNEFKQDTFTFLDKTLPKNKTLVGAGVLLLNRWLIFKQHTAAYLRNFFVPQCLKFIFGEHPVAHWCGIRAIELFYHYLFYNLTMRHIHNMWLTTAINKRNELLPLLTEYQQAKASSNDVALKNSEARLLNFVVQTHELESKTIIRSVIWPAGHHTVGSQKSIMAGAVVGFTTIYTLYVSTILRLFTTGVIH